MHKLINNSAIKKNGENVIPNNSWLIIMHHIFTVLKFKIVMLINGTNTINKMKQANISDINYHYEKSAKIKRNHKF